jgi:hypothetical protein
MSLVSITIFLHFGLGGIADLFLPVGIQLVVRNSSGIAFELY